MDNMYVLDIFSAAQEFVLTNGSTFIKVKVHFGLNCFSKVSSNFEVHFLSP